MVKSPQAGWADPRAKSHTTVSALTQRQRNRFDWGFREARYGRDRGGGGKHQTEKDNGVGAGCGVFWRV